MPKRIKNRRCPSCGSTRINGSDLVRECYDCGEVWDEEDIDERVIDNSDGGKGFHVVNP